MSPITSRLPSRVASLAVLLLWSGCAGVSDRDGDGYRSELDCDDDNPLRFPGAPFDLAYAFNVAPVTREDGRALDEVRALLRPGALLALLAQQPGWAVDGADARARAADALRARLEAASWTVVTTHEAPAAADHSLAVVARRPGG